MFAKLLRIFTFFIPAIFAFLGISYKDSFYFILAGISLIFSILVIAPSLFSEKEFHLPKLKAPQIIKKARKVKVGKKLPKSLLLVIGFIFTVALGIFTYLSIYKLLLPPKETNILFGYYLSQMKVLQEMQIYLVSVVIILILFISTLLTKKKRRQKRLRSFFKILFHSALLVLVTIFVSFNASFLATFLIGTSQVNFLAFRIKISPEKSGIIWGKEAVSNKLADMSKPPKIIGTDYRVERTIIALDIDKDRAKSRFYTQQIVNNIPDIFLTSLDIPEEALIMFGDNLLVTEINKDEIEAISPTIGRLFVRQYLDPRYIKDEPVVKVMGRQEYLKYRDDQINKQIDEIDKLIGETQAYLNQLYSNIQKAKNEISAFDALINDSISKRDSYDSYCRSLSYCGYYYCYDYTDYCNRKREEWNSYIAGLQKDQEEWRVYLGEVQREAGIHEEYKKLLVDYRELVAKQKDIAPQELGLFEPEKSVKVVLESTSSKSLADYFATLVHEYLHYTSYVSEERYLPHFFEEGLTEYFTRKIIKEELNTSTNLGYPLLAKIIREMAKKIPEDDLENIYFNKDEKTLKGLLNNTYGKNFYEDSEFYFTVISYVAPRDALKFANNIMFKIGGSELKEEDLYSSYSEIK